MATRTIASPGVQITEQDLSIITRPIGSTDVLITGFASQGPTEDLVNISDISEFEQVYGAPTNSAERYLYHSAKQILNTSPANLMVSRLPYGADLGEGYTNKYSALIYPVSGIKETVVTNTTYTFNNSIVVDGLNESELLDNLDALGAPYTLYSNTTAAVNTNNYKSTDPEIDTTIQVPIYPTLTSLNIIGVDPADVIQKTRDLSSTYVPTYPYLKPLFELYSDDTNAVNATQWIATELVGNSRTLTIKSSALDTQVTNYTISVSTYNTVVSESTIYQTTTSLVEANSYLVFEPISILLTQEQYDKIISNEIDWSEEINLNFTPLSGFDIIKNSAFIILNKSKTSINDLFEGYYIGLTDNTNINPSTDFDSIQRINTTQTLTSVSNIGVQPFIEIPENRLNFKLTEEYNGFTGNSISETLENYPTGFDFSSASFNDSLVLGVFKLKTSIYNQDTVVLDYKLTEGYTGSLYSKRNQNNPTFGNPNTYFLENIVDNKSDNIKVVINPFISNLGTWTTNSGLPAKKIRISDDAKALYPTGVYTPQGIQETNDLGNVPLKLQRVLNQIQNNDTINIDVVAECGLGTIWVGAKDKKEKQGLDEYIFDDTYSVDISDLKDISGGIVTGINSDYASIANKFVTFVSDRKDHVFIADPLRYIFVQGKNSKAQSKKSSYVFSNDIYWPLKNQFAAYQSSYMAVYGNWIQTRDDISDQFVWVPSSPFVASVYAATSQLAYPWAAPAGFNRGTLFNISDLGITPNQKQSDLLYKININPINFFGNDGYAIFGQKTLYRKPSAFDRINVRRLFLTLEKETKQLLKYYVFEPNTFTTRQRLIGSLQPTFDKAKVNDGLYEYQIICDERNNTPDVIDNNELKISIYIKPVRTAEFILADFIGTRTGVSFSELIG
jgi:hypothetical protein